MGQIRKRGDYYQIRYYRHGQRIEESTGFTRYEEARDVLREREGAVSKDSLERRIKLHLTPAFGGRRLSSITTADLRSFTARRLEAKGPPRKSSRS
jgi:hypothetical protein